MDYIYLKSKKISFVAYMDKYIADLLSGKRTKKGYSKTVSKGYIMNLKSLLNSIRRYELERGRCLSLNDITMSFKNDFVIWNKRQGICNNTISTKMSGIRTVMTAAYEDRLTACDEFRHSGFVPQQEEVDHVFLTQEMIQQMLDLDLSSKESIKSLFMNSTMKQKKKHDYIRALRSRTCKSMEEARDVFIVGCLTGQRVSDYSRYNKDMVTTLEGKTFLRIVQSKTGKLVYIPLDSRVLKILDKYDGTLPEIDYKNIIRHIKMIGELLHWTYKADTDPAWMGSKKRNRFCDLLGTHTARRSFATNAYAAGVPLSSIMAVTGHSSEEMLRRYLKLQSKEKAIIAARDFAGIIITK